MTTTVAQLIAQLQALPLNLEVRICRPASCCCGDCFLPLDEYAEPSVGIETPYGHDADGRTRFVVIS